MTTPSVAVVRGASAARGRPTPGVSRRIPRGTVFVALTVIVSFALVALTGEPLAGLAPILGSTTCWLVLRMPVRWLFFAAMSLASIADIAPVEPTPASGAWQGPTVFLVPLLLDNLNKLTHIEALRISGMEVVLLFTAGLAMIRAFSGQTVDLAGNAPAARPIFWPLAIAFVGVVWLEVWGIGRGGGDFRQSLWQLRILLWFPIAAMIAIYGLRGVRDFRALFYVLTATGAVKVAVGFYYYMRIARPEGLIPATITSHADSVLWMVVIAVWIAAVVERPTRQRVLAAVVCISWLFLGVVLNNRRTAYVTLAALLAVYFTLLPPSRKRLITRLLILASPLIAVYLAIGTRRTTGIFAPAASIMSVTSQKDASSETRDIENYNLLVTLKTSKLLGRGWGHEYIEAVKAYDISTVFAQYRYVAHNSVLWLWSIGGLVGWTMLWLPIGVGAFLARRAHYFARTPDERLAAYASLAVITAYEIQAWADMGVMNWATMSMLGCALAIAAKLAASNGAWPTKRSAPAVQAVQDVVTPG